MTQLEDRDALDLALARTRTELSPSALDKARLRAALGLAELPSRLTPWKALRASGKLGTALGGVLFAAGVATGWGLSRTPAVAVTAAAVAPIAEAAPAEAALDVAALETVAAAPAVSAAAAEPAAPRGERAPQHPRSRPAAVPAPASAKPLDYELALLRRVERALRNADPALALALLGELDARYPQTRLAEERLAARTMAACGLDHADASAGARAFLREHPASVYSERVQSACAIETKGTGSAR